MLPNNNTLSKETIDDSKIKQSIEDHDDKNVNDDLPNQPYSAKKSDEKRQDDSAILDEDKDGIYSNINPVSSLAIFLHNLLSFVTIMHDEVVPLFFMATTSEVSIDLEPQLIGQLVNFFIWIVQYNYIKSLY